MCIFMTMQSNHTPAHRSSSIATRACSDTMITDFIPSRATCKHDATTGRGSGGDQQVEARQQQHISAPASEKPIMQLQVPAAQQQQQPPPRIPSISTAADRQHMPHNAHNMPLLTTPLAGCFMPSNPCIPPGLQTAMQLAQQLPYSYIQPPPFVTPAEEARRARLLRLLEQRLESSDAGMGSDEAAGNGSSLAWHCCGPQHRNADRSSLSDPLHGTAGVANRLVNNGKRRT